jgi:hypothetical protein
MSAKPIHHVFNVAYSGIARELCSDAVVLDPLAKQHLRLTKVVWDTGATNSTLNETIAQRLGLVPTGQIQVHTANGSKIANTYVIDLHLPNNVGIGGLNVSEGDLGPNTEMLIGMDVIGLGDFTVQNFAGKTHFSFCMPGFDNKYDMVEKANAINPRIQKSNSKIPAKL